MVSKFADALEVLVDWLIDKSSLSFYKDTIKRLEDIFSLPEQNKKFVMNPIAMVLRDFQDRKAY